MYKVVIWGTGNLYNQTVPFIKQYENNKTIKVLGITSNDIKYYSIDGYHFILKGELASVDYDFIIVCVHESEGIRKEAISLGIDEKKLINISVIMQIGFDFEKYANITSRNISVISQNCFGGLLCNRLGLRFNSPFVNMWVPFIDYVSLLSNFEDKMKKKVSYYDIGYDEYMNKHFPYPIGDLDGVKLHFNHSNSFEEALVQWEKRKERINMEDIIVFAYTEVEDNEYLDMFENIPYKKVLFTSFNSHRSHTYHIRKETNIYGMDVNAYVNGTKPGFDLFELINGNVKERANCII